MVPINDAKLLFKCWLGWCPYNVKITDSGCEYFKLLSVLLIWWYMQRCSILLFYERTDWIDHWVLAPWSIAWIPLWLSGEQARQIKRSFLSLSSHWLLIIKYHSAGNVPFRKNHLIILVNSPSCGIFFTTLFHLYCSFGKLIIVT